MLPSFVRACLLLLLAAAAGRTGCAQVTTVAIPALADATIYGDSDLLANGSGEHLFVGKTNHAEARRSLLRFDVAAALPSGAKVLAVELQLTIDRTFYFSNLPIAVHRVLLPWAEGPSNPFGEEGGGAAVGVGDATWFRRVYPTSSWNAPGGDHDATPASTCVTPEQFVPVTWPTSARLVADVQSWLDAPGTNHGWLLRTDEAISGAIRRFASRSNPSLGSRPSLRITWLAAGTWGTLDAGCGTSAAAVSWTGTFLPGTTMTAVVQGAQGSTFAAAFFALGVNAAGLPLFPGCQLLLDPGSAVVGGVGALDAAGRLSVPLAIPPAPSLAGLVVAAQALVDVVNPAGLQFSTAAVVVLP